MVFEAHGMSFPCTELLFNYAKVNIVFHSMAPLRNYFNPKSKLCSLRTGII